MPPAPRAGRLIDRIPCLPYARRVRIARSLAPAILVTLAANLVSCSPPAPTAPSAVTSDPPTVTVPPAVTAPAAVAVPVETPWAAFRAERPGALLDAMDHARGDAPGTIARWLLGASPTAPEEPLRAWVVGEADAPSLWLAWP